ncbi:RNA polymerase sigma-70 factor (ECF subfamily) [Rhizomicrobium palustre]|uniref:RNA polymerase sigma factor n=1 Tax=Rhizomicrobium palustre TaxID=189966 RepID=A0A846MZY0_9PROT|nr:sigma-70 family RNA polymerase sigma factor [Rhizomicrobium palustre]NIK89224.1 RNA polymerase sigma-70 factor (ECF subfamily) [Rhizomicrobium palustre]
MSQPLHKPRPPVPNDTAEFRDGLVEMIPVLRAFARSLCGQRDLADDLAQETLAKAWQAREKFQLGTNLKAWLFVILRNEFYSNHRRAKTASDYNAAYSHTGEGAEAEQHARLDLTDLMRAFSQLPSEQKEALILTASEFSYDEAAQICGCAVGTIKSRVSRARKQLQHLVEGTAGQLPDRRDRTDELTDALFRKVREANAEKLLR